MLYRFVHGYSLDHIEDRLKVAGFTIRKYVDIVSDILSDRDKLLSRCISIPTSPRLLGIIDDFHKITCLPNICGAIDETHIYLSERPNRRVTLVHSNFFKRKKFHSIVLQTSYFGMYVQVNLEVFMTAVSSRSLACIKI